MSLVELPLFDDGNPHEIRLFQDMPKGANGTLEQGGKGHVGDNPLLLEELTRFDDFLVTLGREGTVIPTGELEKTERERNCERLGVHT